MHWIELGTALFVYTIVLIVPGPDMVIVYNYSIQKKYNVSVFSGVGYGIAATVLAAFSYFGVSALKDKFTYFGEIMFMISDTLLVWFGCRIKTISSLGSSHQTEENTNNFLYILSVFMLNISNPKVIALLSSIYGGFLFGISFFEAVLFACFCLILKIFWYYMLYNIFSAEL